jgi:hypothetical protein
MTKEALSVKSGTDETTVSKLGSKEVWCGTETACYR